MRDYRRAWHAGGRWFFTVNLLQRQGNDLLTRHIDALRHVVRDVQRRHPFVIHGWVVLPDHMHCVIELPPGDTDFAIHGHLIKMDFSRMLPVTERRNAGRLRRGERGIWQRRYWQHLIRDEADYRAYMDHVPVNPPNHRLVGWVSDWPYSTIHRWAKAGVYALGWAGGAEGVVVVPGLARHNVLWLLRPIWWATLSVRNITVYEVESLFHCPRPIPCGLLRFVCGAGLLTWGLQSVENL